MQNEKYFKNIKKLIQAEPSQRKMSLFIVALILGVALSLMGGSVVKAIDVFFYFVYGIIPGLSTGSLVKVEPVIRFFFMLSATYCGLELLCIAVRVILDSIYMRKMVYSLKVSFEEAIANKDLPGFISLVNNSQNYLFSEYELNRTTLDSSLLVKLRRLDPDVALRNLFPYNDLRHSNAFSSIAGYGILCFIALFLVGVWSNPHHEFGVFFITLCSFLLCGITLGFRFNNQASTSDLQSIVEQGFNIFQEQFQTAVTEHNLEVINEVVNAIVEPCVLNSARTVSFWDNSLLGKVLGYDGQRFGSIIESALILVGVTSYFAIFYFSALEIADRYSRFAYPLQIPQAQLTKVESHLETALKQCASKLSNYSATYATKNPNFVCASDILTSPPYRAYAQTQVNFGYAVPLVTWRGLHSSEDSSSVNCGHPGYTPYFVSEQKLRDTAQAREVLICLHPAMLQMFAQRSLIQK